MLTVKRLTLRSCGVGSSMVSALVVLSGCFGRADIAGSNDEASTQVIVSGLSNMHPEGAGRIRLCHLTSQGTRHPLTVAAAAVPAHLAHGDSLGECPSPCTSAAACDDHSACTQDDCAASGVCTHDALTCNDDNPCTIDACDASIGCTTTAATGGPCNDGNDCTASDACVAGICRGSAIAGCCLADVDCTDDDACTSEQCIERACSNSSVICAITDACLMAFCDPLTGMCASSPLACDDSDACTVDDCDPVTGCHHTGLDCDDQDECTTDRCDPSTGCGHAVIDGCEPSNPCPDGMLPVDSFCMDKYEGVLLEMHDDGSTSPWSPDLNPGLRQMLAMSLPGAIPQAFLSEVQASAACSMAGKRLCTDTEWLRACRGAASNAYPYGSTHVDGVCNDNIDLSSLGLARTGEYAACVSEDRINDLFGNLNEWTSDPAGTSRGGSYVDSQINGVGCSYATMAHTVQHTDERTGFRCCGDLP